MQLIAHNDSVQHLDLPSDMKELYKTAGEIKQRVVLDVAADPAMKYLDKQDRVLMGGQQTPEPQLPMRMVPSSSAGRCI